MASDIPDVVGELKSSPVITRHPGNPVLQASDVPYDAALIFNAGVAKYQGKYVMVFRNDAGCTPESPRVHKTTIGLAYSDDGVKWDVQPKPCFYMEDDEVRRAYDPRLSVIDGRVYMCFAVDTRHGLRGGIAVTDDFEKFEVLSLSVPDNRNMVLFGEKIGGKYVRLERPFPVYSRGHRHRFDTWQSDSPDLKYWGNSHLVLAVEDVPFCNDKTGPAAPPVKTPTGWLTVFHAVDRDESRGKNGWESAWKKRYCAGVMMLDLEEPWKVTGLSRTPLIAPEAPYEVESGFRTNVIFPGGMILEPDGEVKIYYGAADTVECLATAHVDDLVRLCEPFAR
jgi:beta-1,4-mannooligosaccharide/beta-1,4-mannosyl-N-acetylglucosamine phosphorylase